MKLSCSFFSFYSNNTLPKSSDGGNIQKVTNYGSKSGGGSSSGANSDDDKVIYF